MTDRMLDPIRRHIEGANRHDAAAFAAPYARNATNHGRPVGRDGVRRVAESLLAAFPDLHFEIEATVVQGDTVMCEMTMTGTHRGTPDLAVLGGQLAGVAPTGHSVRQRQMHLFRIEGGEIVEHRAVRDDLGLLEQLRLIPPRVNPAEDISRRG
jgi:predicted ester cyclase